MEEFRRFLRYTLPGLVFLVELTIALILTDIDKVTSVAGSDAMNNVFAVVLAVFLGSGALGYIFAAIYWSLYWCLQPVIINHRGPLQALACGGKRMLRVLDERGQPISDMVIRQFDKWTAWTVMSQYYSSSMRSDRKMKHIITYLDGLLDILHGLGATIVGTVFSGVAWALIHHSRLGCNRHFFDHSGDILALAGYIILASSLVYNYYRARLNVMTIENSAVTTSILNEFRRGPERGFPVEICQTEYPVK